MNEDEQIIPSGAKEKKEKKRKKENPQAVQHC